jgi:hypothetical protein
MPLSSEITTLVKILLHRSLVASVIRALANRLDERAGTHDISKFEIDELEGFCQLDAGRGQQREEYGSKNYEDGIENIDAVRLHQSRNRHHPEYWPGGIKDMSFIDIVELLADWEVARRTRDIEEDINKTWLTHQKRFHLSDEELFFLRTLWEKIELVE